MGGEDEVISHRIDSKIVINIQYAKVFSLENESALKAWLINTKLCYTIKWYLKILFLQKFSSNYRM